MTVRAARGATRSRLVYLPSNPLGPLCPRLQLPLPEVETILSDATRRQPERIIEILVRSPFYDAGFDKPIPDDLVVSDMSATRSAFVGYDELCS